MKTLVSEKLEKIRKERKLSRRGLHDISGFKEPTIVSYEKGINQPSNEYLDFVSLYFGYTKDSILDDKTPKLEKMDKIVNTLLMYQSIFNYTDDKMQKLLKGALFVTDMDNFDEKENRYKMKQISYNDFKKYGRISDRADNIIRIAKALNVTYDCLSEFRLIDDIQAVTDDEGYQKYSHYKSFYDDIKESMQFKGEIDLLNASGLNITPEYYANIIKKRNNPETITPLNTLENIPPKHQELLSLLRFAPDSFTDEIIAKLKAMQKLQNLQ